MVDITHYLELETQTCVCQLTRIESYRGIQPISLDLGVAALAAAANDIHYIAVKPKVAMAVKELVAALSHNHRNEST